MDLTLNAAVRCTDGDGGRLTGIILNPLTKVVTDIVVRGPGLLGAERVVPVELVAVTAPEVVTLGLSRAGLSRMQRFFTHEFVPLSDAHPYGALGVGLGMNGTFAWPYSAASRNLVDVGHAAIPPEELAVRRGNRVEATDGPIGHVDAFLLDPTTAAITHLLLREGHLWGRHEVTVPVAQIAAIADGVVRLSVDRRTVEALSSPGGPGSRREQPHAAGPEEYPGRDPGEHDRTSDRSEEHTMNAPLFAQFDNHGPLAQIRTGMAVYDQGDVQIGTVRRVHLGDASQEERDRGQAPATSGPGGDQDDSFLEHLAQVFVPGADLPAAFRERLAREGYLQIDSPGFAADRFATADQIATVGADRVALNVASHALLAG